MEKRTRLFRELSAEGQGQAELEPHLEKGSRTKVVTGSQRKRRSGPRAARRSGPASGREGCGRNQSSGYVSRRHEMMVHPQTTSQQWKEKVFQRLTRKGLLRKARCDVRTMKCSSSIKRNNRGTWSVWRKR